MSNVTSLSNSRRSAASGKRQVIQSVARASKILLAVARSTDGLTASEIATRLTLAMPTAYHLLATLEEEGLLNKGFGKRYALGSSAVDIANSPSLRVRVDPKHRRALAELAEATKETAYLTGWFRGDIRILATVEGSQAVRVAGLEVGLTGDVHARASAKVLLAFADDGQREAVLEGCEFTRFTALTVASPAALYNQLAEIRRDGIFRDTGEYREDVRSLSAPVRRGGSVVAALAVTAPSGRFERSEGALRGALMSAVTTATD